MSLPYRSNTSPAVVLTGCPCHATRRSAGTGASSSRPTWARTAGWSRTRTGVGSPATAWSDLVGGGLPVEVLDARRLPVGWIEPDFDDGHWHHADTIRPRHAGASGLDTPPADPYGPLLPNPLPRLQGERITPVKADVSNRTGTLDGSEPSPVRRLEVAAGWPVSGSGAAGTGDIAGARRAPAAPHRLRSHRQRPHHRRRRGSGRNGRRPLVHRGAAHSGGGERVLPAGGRPVRLPRPRRPVRDVLPVWLPLSQRADNKPYGWKCGTSARHPRRVSPGTAFSDERSGFVQLQRRPAEHHRPGLPAHGRAVQPRRLRRLPDTRAASLGGRRCGPSVVPPRQQRGLAPGRPLPGAVRLAPGPMASCR